MLETAELKAMGDEIRTLTKSLHEKLERTDANDVTVKASIEKVNEQISTVEDQFVKVLERLDLAETKLNRTARGVHEKDQKNAEYANAFSGYCRKGGQEFEQKLLATNPDTDGGYLVPENIQTDIIKTLTERSPIRSLARIVTIGRGDSFSQPKKNGRFTTQKGTEKSVGAVTTTGTLAMERIPVHIREARPQITQILLDDSDFNFEGYISEELQDEFEVQEGTDFILGDGVGEPEGLLTKSGVTEIVSGSATLLDDSDAIMDMFYGLPTFYAKNGTWLLNRTTIKAIRKLKDTNGVYIWMAGIAGTAPNTILGAPYVEATDMPVIAANAFPIIFGDIRRAYTIVDRQGIRMLRDVFTAKPLVEFYSTRRYGGQVVLTEAIVKLKIST